MGWDMVAGYNSQNGNTASVWGGDLFKFTVKVVTSLAQTILLSVSGTPAARRQTPGQS